MKDMKIIRRVGFLSLIFVAVALSAFSEEAHSPAALELLPIVARA